MGSIYGRPLRVYFVIGVLAFIGVLAGLNLPISLFPNSSQPELNVNVSYGDVSPQDFQFTYGAQLEGSIKATVVDGYHVSQLTTEYRDHSASYRVQFQWGADGQKAQRELQNLTSGLSGSWPEEIRKSVSVNFWSENGGFLAISFFSNQRSLDEIFEILNPLLSPQLSSIQDSSDIGLWNPQQKSIEVLLDPDKLASFQLLPSDIEYALNSANIGYSGGSLILGEGNQLNIVISKKLQGIEDLGKISLKTPAGQNIQIKDVATIRLAIDKKNTQVFKTNGAASLILFASPKPGGNIKKMADDLLQIVEKTASSFPKDIEYRVLVNPSQFIDSSVRGVLREVGIAALLAVIILFLFIGSFKNVITAAIEIPISIVMAFILMKIFGMNLNLISLGGLALSAGMNVDASVVVMENIFRHFAEHSRKILGGSASANVPALSFQDRLDLIIEAVNEVRAPIISSTIASLVVFIPLIATKGLTNSILGDLAKAVVFSHSLSAIVALILVPTIRLQMMKGETNFHPKGIIDGPFLALENFYGKILKVFLARRDYQVALYGVAISLLVSLVLFVVPKLPKEIIGRPDTDWIILGIRPQNFTEPRQLSSLVEKIEFDVLQKYELDMRYTFTQLRGASDGMIMIRLKSKDLMSQVWKRLEEEYTNTPEIVFFVVPWNPSELKIPDPPQFRLEVRGGTSLSRAVVSQDLKLLLQDKNVFPRVNQTPGFSGKEKYLNVSPYTEVLQEMSRSVVRPISLMELGNYLRVATEGKRVGYLGDQVKSYPINMKMGGRTDDSEWVRSVVDIKALPVAVQAKILPLSALLNITEMDRPPTQYRVDQADLNIVTGKETENNKDQIPQKKVQAEQLFNQWLTLNQARLDKEQLTVTSVDPDVELNQAIDQLKIALMISVFLIFFTMLMQFGDIVLSLLVLVSVPLGIIGVILSLWIFHSTLSLNSILGVILLNGIAVANSVILVDFIKKLVDSGEGIERAALYAAKTRLRPIMMTSLTTVLGMAPIALGLGEGGKILQPLGIAVSGGLWISMLLTLFIVPSLQVAYLKKKPRTIPRQTPSHIPTRQLDLE